MAGIGGGGFNPGGYGGSPQSSSQSPGGGEKKDRVNTFTPLSIAQIKGAQPGGDNLTVDGKELGFVSVVGVVRQVENMTTKRTYQIEDHTGVIDVTKWVEEEEEGDGADIRENVYVRVVGNIKPNKGTNAMSAYHISQVTNTNEMTMHLLDIIHTHLKNTKGSLDAPQQAAAPMQTGGGGSFADPAAGGLAGGQATGGQYAYQQQAQSESVGTPCQNCVLECIKQSSDETGVSITSICESLAGRFNETDIRSGLDFLSNEGHIYSTIDDDHYRSTDA